jgi:hypothetical protein
MDAKTQKTESYSFFWLTWPTEAPLYEFRKKDLQYYELQQTAGLGSKKP